MHNPAAVLENDSHKLLWDFDIHTDHLISTRTRPNNNQQKEKKERICRIVDFAVPADHKKMKECEKKYEYLDLARELKNRGTWRWQLYQL